MMDMLNSYSCFWDEGETMFESLTFVWEPKNKRTDQMLSTRIRSFNSSLSTFIQHNSLVNTYKITNLLTKIITIKMVFEILLPFTSN